MSRTTKSLIKILPLFILFTQSFSLWSQEDSNREFRFELGGGYEYSFLERFNEEFVKNQSNELYNSGMNSGWSLTGSPTFQLNRFLKVGVDLNFRSYSKSGYVENIHFDDGTEGGPNFHYNLEGKLRINNFGFGISGTIYFDQFKDKSQNTKFNYGLDLIGSYVTSKIRDKKIMYMSSTSNEYLNVYTVNYWNLRAGLNVRYNLNQSIFRSISLKTGWHQALNATIPITEDFGNPSYIRLNLSGFYAELCFELGKSKN